MITHYCLITLQLGASHKVTVGVGLTVFGLCVFVLLRPRTDRIVQYGSMILRINPLTTGTIIFVFLNFY